MLYLIGYTLFRLRMIGSVSPKRIAAIVALGVLAAVGNGLSAVALCGAVAALLTALSLWEYEPLRTRLRPKPAPSSVN